MPASTHRGPRIVGRLLPPDLKRAFRTRGFVEAAILTEWHTVVGETLAARSCPERLGRDGTLRIRVASGAALELQHLAPQIMERIATFFGYRAVARLALIQGPVRSPRRPVRLNIPAPSPESEARIAMATAEIADPTLREALRGLGRSVLGSAEAG